MVEATSSSGKRNASGWSRPHTVLENTMILYSQSFTSLGKHNDSV